MAQAVALIDKKIVPTRMFVTWPRVILQTQSRAGARAPVVNGRPPNLISFLKPVAVSAAARPTSAEDALGSFVRTRPPKMAVYSLARSSASVVRELIQAMTLSAVHYKM